MNFPEIRNIVESAQESRLIKDPFFDSCSVVLNSSGTPFMFGGGFSQVFQIEKESTKWAFKVWVQKLENNEKRYQALKCYLNKTGLPYFVEFEYVPNGLVVDGNHLPTLRMPWIDGELLKYYINSNVNDSSKLKALAQNFLRMTKDLHSCSISHGDLKSDNIFVTNEGAIILIDYDSICIPQFESEIDICVGTEGYQHPLRIYHGHLSSTKVDHFSELIIYLSIMAIAENPLLWQLIIGCCLKLMIFGIFMILKFVGI
jgi:serine/threonine protein kinase